MRQLFLQTIATACFVFLCQSSLFAQEGGYLSSLSVAKGEKLGFYISTTAPVYDLPIYRLGSEKKLVLTLSFSGGIQTISDSAYITGCNWNETVGLTIPDDWVPGVYEADLPTSQGIKRLLFVVREKILGSYSKAVVCLTTNTWQAYNNWGGKSLYNYNSSEKTGSVKVSYNRPFSDTTTSLYYLWTDKLVRWLEKVNIPVEFCTSSDLDRDPKFLDNYDVYSTVGHDEYWSSPERTQFENFLSRGGKMIILSGNTSWWQVRFEDSLRTLVCYRDYSKDPFYPTQTSLVTSVWGRYPLFNAENSVTGVSFEHGGYVNDDTVLPPSKGYGGYTVYNSRNWIFGNTELQDGDIIDSTDAIVGYETDGALFYWHDGVPVPTSIDHTPTNFRILGISPAAGSDNVLRGHSTMGYYVHPGGGAVFNSASINWVNGLAGKDTIVPQILRNVFAQFLNKKTLPPDIITAEPIRVSKAYINHDSVQFSRRMLALDYTSIDTFIVHAVDLLAKKLFYSWQIGGNILSSQARFILTPAIKKYFPRGIALEVFVSNSTDTVSMDWTLINSKLSIVTYPPSPQMPLRSHYRYNAKALSAQNAHITYALYQAPQWLHINHHGVIYGNIDTLIGNFSVTLLASDTYGNADSQKFVINVIDTVKKKDTTIVKDTTHKDTTNLAAVANVSTEAPKLQCYPNPFSDRSNITVTLAEDARVEIEIFDVTGNHITQILAPQNLYAGSHTLIWNRMTEDARKVPEGIYFCRMTITASGKIQTIVEKLIAM